MCKMYGIIEGLCIKRGIKPGKMCAELGISRGIMGDLKAGRTKKLSAENIEKISKYFGVSSDYLLGTPETKKTPTPESEREMGFDDFTYAMYNEGKELTEESKKKLLEMARFFREQEEKEKGR